MWYQRWWKVLKLCILAFYWFDCVFFPILCFSSSSTNYRTAPGPVVGWPPIRSFRKNLASSSSSKPAPVSQNGVPDKVASRKPVETCRKGLFVKINMDGLPIGRKVDLKAYNSYEKLSSAVDELFRGLIAGYLHCLFFFFQMISFQSMFVHTRAAFK